MALRKHPIDAYREEYGLTAFIETGTNYGASVIKAMKAGYAEVFSCEIGPELVEKVKASLRNEPFAERVHLYTGSSAVLLPRMLEDAASHARALIYLDAHSDPALFGLNIASTAKDLPSLMPLMPELAALKSGRDTRRDVIVIDDLHLICPPYWTGPDRPELPAMALPRQPLFASTEALAAEFPHHAW
ncbi:MAG: hypothetical protein AAB426_13905, partial [Myxococcota bacterium]